jgi:hypothetical protein
LHSEVCRGSKLRGNEIRPTGKAFGVILTGDQGAVSVRDIGDDEEDRRTGFSECAWSKCVALVVHAKIFISEIVEYEQHYINTHPRLKTKESFTAILTSIPTRYMKDVGFESIVTIAPYGTWYRSFLVIIQVMAIATRLM